MSSTPNSKKSDDGDAAFSFNTPSPRKQKNHRHNNKNGKGNGNSGSKPHPSPRQLPRVDGPTRKLYLIRHGESLGQRASRQARKTDERLTDCGLTRAGIEQAKFIPQLLQNIDIQLVVTSPLTRAIHTALLAFPTTTTSQEKGGGLPILMGYDLREVGSVIPENTPRKFKDIWRDLQVDQFTLQRIDFQALKSTDDADASWPKGFDTPPKVVRRDRIRQVFGTLAASLPPQVNTIAVVCHYNVIRATLSDPHSPSSHPIHPINAQPIECNLHANGWVEFVRCITGDEDDDDDNNRDDNNIDIVDDGGGGEE